VLSPAGAVGAEVARVQQALSSFQEAALAAGEGAIAASSSVTSGGGVAPAPPPLQPPAASPSRLCDASVDTSELEALHRPVALPTPSMLDRLASASPATSSPPLASVSQQAPVMYSAHTQTTPRRGADNSSPASPKGAAGLGSARPPLPPLSQEALEGGGLDYLMFHTGRLSQSAGALSPTASCIPTGHGGPWPGFRAPSPRPASPREYYAAAAHRSMLGMGHPAEPASPREYRAPAVRHHSMPGMAPLAGAASAPVLPPIPPASGSASGWPWGAPPPHHFAPSCDRGNGASCLNEFMPPLGTDQLWSQEARPPGTPWDSGPLRGRGSSGKNLGDDAMLMRAYEIYRQQQLDLLQPLRR